MCAYIEVLVVALPFVSSCSICVFAACDHVPSSMGEAVPAEKAQESQTLPENCFTETLTG